MIAQEFNVSGIRFKGSLFRPRSLSWPAIGLRCFVNRSRSAGHVVRGLLRGTPSSERTTPHIILYNMSFRCETRNLVTRYALDRPHQALSSKVSQVAMHQYLGHLTHSYPFLQLSLPSRTHISIPRVARSQGRPSRRTGAT